MIDFQQNESLFNLVDSFIENEVHAYDSKKSLTLSNLLKNPRIEFNLFANKKVLRVKTEKKQTKNNQTKSTKIPAITIKKRIFNQKNLKRSKSTENLTHGIDSSISLNSTLGQTNWFFGDYPIETVASQLTLIEWDNFLDIHVCHCLNSKAQGVNCNAQLPIDPSSINSNQCLFVDNYLCKSLYKMIQFNYLLSHWVSAEILMIDNLKVTITHDYKLYHSI